MSIVNAIYQAPIIREACLDTTGETRVTIRYNGHTYTGYANLHPEDSEFFSPRVGKRIATSRARVIAMEAEIERLESECKVLTNFFFEIKRDKSISLERTFFILMRKIKRLQRRKDAVRLAIKREKTNLGKYLIDQGKALGTIKRMRQQDKTN